jgi:hypothetical protein
MTNMWILFAIVIFGIEGPTVDYKPFNNQAECEAAKTVVTKAIAAKSPQAKLSLTCFHATDIGNVS